MSSLFPGPLRDRDGAARVTPFELFFDLVFVFAVTQLSHRLLEHLTPRGAAETLLLLLAVWWAWMYTSWTTNWFDPDNQRNRIMLAGVMLASMIMSASIPHAFDDGRALWFAGAYVAVQAGRTFYVVVVTRRHELGPNFRRIMVWIAVPATVWIAGALVDDQARIWFWTAAVVLEYAGPWAGYRVPGLGRSRTTDWTIDGEHMAERCRLFTIIALGESLLITGATFAGHDPTAATTLAMVQAFLTAAAMWWLYFDRAADAAAELIAGSDDPGRLGRIAYTFVHLPMIAGIIVTAVGDELVMAHPGGHVSGGTAAVVLGGPALFVFGHALFKRVVFGHLTAVRVTAVLALAALGLTYSFVTPLFLACASTAVMVILAVWDVLTVRAFLRRQQSEAEAGIVAVTPSGGPS
ncbi:low temperature requirement protein A [Spirillospora sp. NPDC048911]|uniref:low temperature requirement protein A n=1 Tax=Spirillospora sp. NPDC048911 TaxID=3364527 RepID=UPI003715C7E8